jgi:acid phosphatase (class A)
MVPEKVAAIFDRAGVFAYNRVIAGVHYPSDVEAGRISGAVIDNVLLHDPRFHGRLRYGSHRTSPRSRLALAETVFRNRAEEGRKGR